MNGDFYAARLYRKVNGIVSNLTLNLSVPINAENLMEFHSFINVEFKGWELQELFENYIEEYS